MIEQEADTLMSSHICYNAYIYTHKTRVYMIEQEDDTLMSSHTCYNIYIYTCISTVH